MNKQNPTETKNLLIFHNKDNDGLFSGALMFQHLNRLSNNDTSIVPYNYEDFSNFDTKLSQYLLQFNNAIDFDNIFMLDVTTPINWFANFYVYVKETDYAGKNIIINIFDHHEPKIQEIIDLFDNMNFDKTLKNVNHVVLVSEEINFTINIHKTKNSAAKLVWDYLVENNLEKDNYNKKNTINLVSDYDTWQWIENYNEPNTLALYNELYFRNMYKKMLVNKTTSNYMDVLVAITNKINNLTNEDCFNIYSEGEQLYNERVTEIGTTGFTVGRYKSLNIVFIFNEICDYTSQTAARDFCKKYYETIDFDFMVFVSFKITEVSVSVRRINEELDCNLFVQEFSSYGSGGGHQGAAGLRFSMNDFDQFNKRFNYGISQ